jgi:hypothetical protein
VVEACSNLAQKLAETLHNTHKAQARLVAAELTMQQYPILLLAVFDGLRVSQEQPRGSLQTPGYIAKHRLLYLKP